MGKEWRGVWWWGYTRPLLVHMLHAMHKFSLVYFAQITTKYLLEDFCNKTRISWGMWVCVIRCICFEFGLVCMFECFAVLLSLDTYVCLYLSIFSCKLQLSCVFRYLTFNFKILLFIYFGYEYICLYSLCTRMYINNYLFTYICIPNGHHFQ